ncbi:uncharacterized protein F5Z01DRAFT_450691 [Emericellopsis atlantica]|uniref:WSC domain-containing protein n=1 Tax=Emericellopsis atlantica TaxID=2614577 RepID=A0A9P7ZSP5_9HYPO|nr:uncharacterized protein F5Z01DRAFT_450691 [Emericellopsis atlantica]KAG9257087.1 hypothetical protein F5Z01DRAFT_450691 [Emericellopsis atlantica]
MKWLILAGLCEYALSTPSLDFKFWGDETPQNGKITSQGCFKNEADLTLMADVKPFTVSAGACAQRCLKDESDNYTIMGLQGHHCWCGSHMPQEDDKTAAEDCNYACPGYPGEACGGVGDNKAFNIFNLGIDLTPDVYGMGGDDSSEDNSDKTTSTDIIATTESATSTVTSEGETVTVTTTSTPDGTPGGNPTSSTRFGGRRRWTWLSIS